MTRPLPETPTDRPAGSGDTFHSDMSSERTSGTGAVRDQAERRDDEPTQEAGIELAFPQLDVHLHGEGATPGG